MAEDRVSGQLLLPQTDMNRFQAAPHGPRTEAACSDGQALLDHPVDDELVTGFAELQAALDHVISELVLHQGYQVRGQCICHLHLLHIERS